MKKAWVILLISILFTESALAIEQCHDRYMRGDSNRDGVLNIGDAIFTLSYLFNKGVSSSCLEQGDINGDNKIDISDAVYTLSFLFNNGPSPKNPEGNTEFYGDGINNPPKLAFLSILDQADLDMMLGNIPEDQNHITEIDISSYPMMLSVTDLNNEGDIMECVAKASLDDGSEIILSQTEWDDIEYFEGNDLSIEPYLFLLSTENGITPGLSYLITTACTDKNGQTGSARLKVNTKEEVHEITSICDSMHDACCSYKYAETPELICLKDCDYDKELNMHLDIYQPSCSKYIDNIKPGSKEGDWQDVDFENCINPLEGISYNEIIDYTFKGIIDGKEEFVCSYAQNLFDSLREPESLKVPEPGMELTRGVEAPGSTTTSPCWVQDMTILRKKGQQVPKNFKIIERIFDLDEQKQIIGKIPFLKDPGMHFGSREGWVAWGKELQYNVVYEFIVYAKLTKKSTPDSCPEAQFVQTFVETTKYPDDRLYPEIPNYMYSSDDLRKKSLKELSLIDAEIIEKFRTFKKYSKEFDLSKLPPEAKAKICYPGGGIWCSDGYVEIRKGPYADVVLGKVQAKEGDIKKHFTGSETQDPEIIWSDMPGPMADLHKISVLSTYNIKSNFMSIIEDSESRAPDENGIFRRERIRCELNGLEVGGEFQNKQAKSSFVEPTCACIWEKRVEGSINDPNIRIGEWYEFKRFEC